MWFRVRIKKQSKGEAYYFRFADDFLACFQHEEDAQMFRERLKDRLEGFGLELSEEKTKRIEFGRFARENAYKKGNKPEEFDFLGFTHYCGKTKKGYFRLKRRTSRKKFSESLKAFTEWARKSRNILTKAEMIKTARVKIIGHLNYYAITDNLEKCSAYIHFARRILFKWLNRKSQRKAYTWDGFSQVLNWLNFPEAKLKKNINPSRQSQVC
jgi:hypothetical protein